MTRQVLLLLTIALASTLVALASTDTGFYEEQPPPSLEISPTDTAARALAREDATDVTTARALYPDPRAERLRRAEDHRTSDTANLDVLREERRPPGAGSR